MLEEQSQIIQDIDTSNFINKVIEESKNNPVIVDFWATWCNPCKQLTPILEKVVLQMNGKVKLVKVDLNKIAEDNQKIKLDLTSFKERSNEFAIPMPSITSGKYNILWRALSPDGHIIKGKSEFEVK